MYQKINEKNFYGFASKPNVLIKFGATWCGPCKTADKILEEIGRENPDAVIVGVDVDESQSLAASLNITQVPFYVRMQNGKIVDKLYGLQAKSKCLELITEPEEKTNT